MRRGWVVVSLLAAVLVAWLVVPLGSGLASAQAIRSSFSPLQRENGTPYQVTMPGLFPVPAAARGNPLGITSLQSATTTPEPGKPVARFLLFYSETCPHCHEIMENYLPTVYEKYGDQVEYQYINLYNNTEGYLTMLGLEKKLGVPEDLQGGVPTLVIGDKVLKGSVDIPAKLEGYIDEYLAQGGVDYPSLEDLPEVVLPTPAPTVQALVFFDPEHPDFDALNTLILELAQQYPDELQAFAVDITAEENASRLAELNQAFGVVPPATGTPEIVVDRRLLVGIKEIQAELPGLLEQYVAQGGSSIPAWEELVGGESAATPTPEAEPTGVAPKPIHLAYFEQAGCQECARTSYDLEVVKEQVPQVQIETFSIEDEESKALNEWLSERSGVPVDKRLSTPMIFVGKDVLIGTEANLNNLLLMVAKYAETGAERTWDDFDPDEGGQAIVNRFQSFSALTVLGAGLIDGLNPCAFATLVFFISYLAFSGRRGRDILLVGTAFALGVFLTYLLVGVGLLRVVQSLGFFTALGRWVYLLTALLCGVLAVLTFRDFSRARKGKTSEMTLRLPKDLQRRIHKVIREGAHMRAFVAVAFFTGFVVSLLELACTGQVYLPTIVYVMSRPELASQAFLYLFLYCVMFILPLVVVFVLSYFGTTSEQLGQFVDRHTSTIKLITGLLFVGLTLWMTWTLAPLFAIHSPWNWVLMAAVLIIIAIGVGVLHVIDKRAPSEPTLQRRKRRGRRSRA